MRSLFAVSVIAIGCGDDTAPPDAPIPDAPLADAPIPDAPPPDAPPGDAEEFDSLRPDARSPDAGPTCNLAADCATGFCNRMTHRCQGNCDTNTPCRSGCCITSTGTCSVGTFNSACGDNGGLCTNCMLVNLGHICVVTPNGGTCGCNSQNDCSSAATGCSTSQLCTISCSSTVLCTTGCCSSASNGTCQTGQAAGACGGNGSLCSDCTTAAAGHACLPGFNERCGCTSNADCPGGTCNLATYTCI